MATEYNSVPLGQAGTGAAFTLPGSQAANQLLNTLQYNQQINQQEQLLKQKQAQQLADSWKQNQLKVEGGMFWEPEFKKRNQEHLQKGIQLRQMGIDPFNYNPSDPTQSRIAEDYLLERQAILSDTAKRKALEPQVKDLFERVSKNPSGIYSSDVEALNNYINTPFSEASNMQIPTLQDRFNPNSVLSKVTPAQVGNEVVIGNQRIKSTKALPAQTREAIVSSYKNDPATERWVDEMTGRQGFTISDLERIPATPENIRKKIESDYKGNPDLRARLATAGILPNTPAYDNYVNSQTQRLYNAKSTWENQVESDLQQVLPKVKEMSSTLPDFSMEDQDMKRRRLALSEQANARAKSKFNAWWDDKQKSGSYEKLLRDGATLKPDAVREIRTVLDEVGANVRRVYDEDIVVDGKKTRFKDAMIIDLPVETEVTVKDSNGKPKKDSDGKEIKEKKTINKRYVFNSKDGGRRSEILLNQILQRAKSFGAVKQEKVIPYSEFEELPTIDEWDEIE